MELTQRYERLRQQTIRLARQHGWPLRKNYSNGRILRLQEIDPLGQPVYYTTHNAEAARGTRTQALNGGGSLPVALSGNSTFMSGRLGLWDGGRVQTAHQEFEGLSADPRVVQRDKPTTASNHATHLAGTLVAQGINAQAKGMAFGALLSVWDYTDDVSELSAAASNLLISNHAYGPVVGWVYNPSRPGTNPDQKWEWWGNTTVSATEDYLFGFYTTKARDLDRIAYNNPFYLMVRSADNKRGETGPPAGIPYFLKNTNTQSTLSRSRNDAYDVIPAEATAKNVLTVGAANLTYTNQSQPVALGTTSFSGWGPTDDGRIKPDLLGVGTNVFSTIASSNTAYDTYSGTSMASANVAGSLFLLQELYAQQRVSGTATSGAFMRAATLRGLVLHTADRLSPATGPDYRQGWGLLNTEAAARLLLNKDLAYRLLEQTLASGSTFTQHIQAQGGEPLVITLCWTDPEGAATAVAAGSVDNQTPKLTNDLDLRLSDGNALILPFVLDPNHPDRTASRGDNIRDNVEQVYVANPVPGKTYSLTVSHKGKMTYSSQPFSLIISGLQRTHCQLTAAIIPSADAMICAGATLPLRSSSQAAGLTYQWFRNDQLIPNAEGAEWSVTQAGSYNLRVTDEKGCQATSQPVQVAVRMPSVTITPTEAQWVCSGDEPIVLTANGDADSPIDWLRDGLPLVNSQTTTLKVTQPGRYQARLTQAGCQALSPETIVRLTSVNNIDLVPKETRLTLPQGATVVLKAPIDSTYRYQWYRDGKALNQANEYRLTVAQPGTYRVQVRQQHCVGWSTERTVLTTVLTSSLTAAPDGQFVFYPNPAENTLSIRYSQSSAKTVRIGVFDVRGVNQRPVLTLKAVNGEFAGEVSLAGLLPGHYILRLTDGTRTETARFLKK